MSEKPEKALLEHTEPRLVTVRYYGTVDLAEAARVMDFIEGAVGGQPYFLFEAFMDGMVGATPEGRGHAAERLRALPQRAIAIVGRSFTKRVLGKLVLTASIMLDRGNKNNEGAVFKEHDEAQKWLQRYARACEAEEL